MNPKLLFLALATPIFAATVYTDGTFTNGVGQAIDLQTSAGSTLSITQGSTTGNPGNFANVQFAFTPTPTGQTKDINRANFRSDFLWDPSVDGPLGTINFSMDVKNLSSTGFSSLVSVFWRPVILQSGLTFSVLSSSLQATPGGSAFQPLIWNFTSVSNWVNFENSALIPNFSAGGAPILFGYRVQIGVACSGGPANSFCPATTVNDAMDNFRVELTAAEQPSGIPEPSAWALGLAGLAALAFKQRQLSKNF